MLASTCPNKEALLELVSIPAEISAWKTFQLRLHMRGCAKCRETTQAIREKWNAYFSPAPDITSSLIRIYSKLQKDETLVLKGWKLNQTAPARGFRHQWLNEGWLFRGGVSLGLASVAAVFFFTQNQDRPKAEEVTTSVAANFSSKVPMAQIRVEEKNSVKVHYVQPELLQSVEFETTSQR